MTSKRFSKFIIICIWVCFIGVNVANACKICDVHNDAVGNTFKGHVDYIRKSDNDVIQRFLKIGSQLKLP